MNKKHLILAFGVAFLSGASLMSCDSKKENKAQEVQDKKEDVIEAQQEGDTAKVRDEQKDLDSARKDYREAVKDSVKDARN